MPITADAGLFDEAVSLGRRLLWIQTYAERFRNGSAGRGDRVPAVAGLAWTESVKSIPEDPSQLSYDATSRRLTISDGAIVGVLPEVWSFSVSGLPVVARWLGSRTAKGIGRASQEKRATPLDRIRPIEWEDAWNDELLDLLRVLTHTVATEPLQADLLQRIVNAPLIGASELPMPTAMERAVPQA